MTNAYYFSIRNILYMSSLLGINYEFFIAILKLDRAHCCYEELGFHRACYMLCNLCNCDLI